MPSTPALLETHGQVLDAGIADRVDQRLGNAAQPEAAGHDHHAVLQQAGERRFGVRIDLVHETMTWMEEGREEPA